MIKKILLILFILVVSILGFFFLPEIEKDNVNINESREEDLLIKYGEEGALFFCDDRKSIFADFKEEEVFLMLSDSRTLTLSRLNSSSDLSYSNRDESFVFLIKEGKAFIYEKNQNTFKNCALDREKEKYDDTLKKEEIVKEVDLEEEVCLVSGCAGEICSEEYQVSPCIYIPENDCYKTAICERQEDEKCGWTETEELLNCLREARETSFED